MRLQLGKMPREVLENIIFRYLGTERKEVILKPTFGENGSIISLINDKVMISSMDPITGAVERVGWLAVHICANDVATFGIHPLFFSSCILLPENASLDILENICRQIDAACKEIKTSVIGGHTEVTPGLSNPIVIGHCIGLTEKNKYVTSGGAKAGDVIIMTKEAAIEGTAILATDCYEKLKGKISGDKLLSAQNFYKRISVVRDAIIAFETGGVNAMHDPTEGGIAGGLHEMANASRLGFEIFEESIPIANETLELCKFFSINPLQLMSSGALLIAAKPKKADEILEKLEGNKIKASIIGEFLLDQSKKILVKKDSEKKRLIEPKFDSLWIALKKYNLMQ